MLSGFGRRQDANHLIPTISQGVEVTEEDLMVAQSIGGHQSIGQTPAGVWDAENGFQDLTVTWQASKSCPVQSVSTGFPSPVLRQFDVQMPRQG